MTVAPSSAQDRIAGTIAAEINAQPRQVTAAVELLDGGSTVPFGGIIGPRIEAGAWH